MERIYVDKYTGRLERADLYRVNLILLRENKTYENLEPRRLFPIHHEEMYVTLLDGDEKEVGFVRDFKELDEGSAQVLRDCLYEYYLIPKITKILSVDETPGNIGWHVMTDRGELTFRIRNRNQDVFLMWGTNRFLIQDKNDNRYEIPDYKKLDKHSLALIGSYM